MQHGEGNDAPKNSGKPRRSERMKEKKYEVWWNENPLWAESCELAYGRVILPDPEREPYINIKLPDGFIESVRTAWVHPVEPEIAPGTLVLYWDGDEKPKTPPVGYYSDHNEDSYAVDVKNVRGKIRMACADHVEPVAIQPDIRWDKLNPNHVAVIVYDSGAVWPSTTDSYTVDAHDAFGTVVKIIPRPTEDAQ